MADDRDELLGVLRQMDAKLDRILAKGTDGTRGGVIAALGNAELANTRYEHVHDRLDRMKLELRELKDRLQRLEEKV